MNVTNSRYLLLGILVCLMFTPLSAVTHTDTDSIKKKNKELIIVSIDENLQSSVIDLTNYVKGIYSASEEDMIYIKTYLHPEDAQSQSTVEKLVASLVNSGIPKKNIEIVSESKYLSHPYFSLAITENSKVQ